MSDVSGAAAGAGANGAAGAAGSPGAAGEGGAGAAAPWYNGADSETVGYLQNKGWDKLAPDKAALAALKSYREAEKHLHTPPDQLLRFPKNAADTENWNNLHTRLGVPADAKEYDFSAIKFSDGTALDDAFANTMREALKQAAVPKDRAGTVVQSVVKFMEQAEAADTAEKAAALAAQKESLKINWGNNLTANLILAQNAAQRLNVSPEAITALESVIGYDKVMEMFRNIGMRTGEDKFISSAQGANGGIMSRDQANATLAEKMNDQAWSTRLFAGDATAKREFDNLSRIIANAG